MSALALALERKDWSIVVLCLLVGVTEAAAKLPPETLDALLEILVEVPPAPSDRAPKQARRRQTGVPW